MNKKAFTLVELVITITILVILSTIAFVSFQSYTQDSRDANRLASINEIQKWLMLSYSKNGTFPTPKNATTYTWGTLSVLQWVLTQEVLPELQSDPKDPLSKSSYTYSITGDGEWYQIASDIENPDVLASSDLPSAHAKVTSALVKGNYKLDPSLPSLILIPTSSLTNSWLFSPWNCFVVNGGGNTLWNTSCLTKKDISLRSVDTSLLAYYDMETYYQTTFSGVSNVVMLQDLSGNNHDMFLSYKITNSTLLTTTTLSGNIFSDAFLGKWLRSTSAWTPLWSATLKANQSLSYSGRLITPLPYSTLESKLQSQNGGLSVATLVQFHRAQSVGHVNRVASIFLNNTDNVWVDPGDNLKGIDMGLQRFYPDTRYQTHITPYNDGTGTGVYGIKWCGNGNLTIWWEDLCFKDEFNKFYENTFDGKMFIVTNVDFTNRSFCTYVNGVKFRCETVSISTIQRMIEKGNKNFIFVLSSDWEPLEWVVDEGKLYNRILTQQEIEQQAKIYWF